MRHKNYFDPKQEPFKNLRDTYSPLVWQCRYGGVEVPDHLWRYKSNGVGKKYSENQAEDLVGDHEFMGVFDQWVSEFVAFTEKKGKVKPGKYRAFGYTPPGHFIKDVRLGWRSVLMRMGLGPKNSSPHEQDMKGLNQDRILNPQKSEGERLRH